MKKRFNMLSLKSRIIIIFSMITMLLTAGMAWLSYGFVRDIYLRQVEDDMHRFSRMISAEMDLRYLRFVEPRSGNLAGQHYKEVLSKQVSRLQLANAFIFDDSLRVVVSARDGISAERLLMNRLEIRALDINASSSSLPFRGADDAWYVWGFYRLDSHYFLGVQESADKLNMLDRLGGLFLMIGGGGILLTILSGWMLARAIARPIDRLVNFSAEIGRGKFDASLSDKISGELAILRDALLRMRDEISRNQSEKEKMLAQIAHEIRNPLGGMELLAGLVKESLEPGSQNAAYLERILQEIQGLKSQITSYLNYSRPMPASPENIDLPELLIETISLFDNRLREKNIRFILPEVQAPVWFDRQHLRQILINLISNSLEAAPQGSRITVTNHHENGRIIIRVSDEGSGVPEELYDKIFEPFFTTRTDGAGLGLAVCKKLCTENGAYIRLATENKKGCVIEICRDMDALYTKNTKSTE